MLKFHEWTKVNELRQNTESDTDQTTINSTVKELQGFLKQDLGELVVIPNLDKFIREDEPVQQRAVFATKDKNSFGVNFTEDGKIYSVDFYKENSRGSELTMYVKKGSISKIAKVIPFILPDPKPLKQKDLQQLVENIHENEISIINEDIGDEKLEVHFKVPPVSETPARHDDLYDYGDPKVIFEDLRKYVDMVIDGKQSSLVITGSPGVGKTFIVTKQLEDHGLKKGEDWIHVKGRSTPAGLYISLYENRNKILVVDDCDSVFKNDEAVNILKGALDSYEEREISWLVGKPIQSPSTGLKIPTKFVFSGAIIFISNLPQKKIDYAIKSRSFVLEVALTPKDMIERMENELPKIYPSVPLGVKRTALQLIENAAETTEHLELSMRTLIKAIKILEEVDSLAEAKRLILQQCSYK